MMHRLSLIAALSAAVLTGCQSVPTADEIDRMQAPDAHASHAKNLMKTDVREMDGSYELDVDLPGFKKDEVHVDLKNGYLTISAEKGLDKDESDKKGKYIRQERYAGACSRSFYVGEDVEPQDVKAKYENGVLKLFVPKAEVKQVPAQTAIAIE